jgi:hypothetical protein
MHNHQAPSHWIPPVWHADFGNATLELDHLREFSTRLLSDFPTVDVTLETPEPGLMDVQVRLGEETAEVYSVPSVGIPDKRRYAIFFSPGTPNEEEVYAESMDSAMSQFKKRLGMYTSRGPN